MHNEYKLLFLTWHLKSFLSINGFSNVASGHCYRQMPPYKHRIYMADIRYGFVCAPIIFRSCWSVCRIHCTDTAVLWNACAYGFCASSAWWSVSDTGYICMAAPAYETECAPSNFRSRRTICRNDAHIWFLACVEALMRYCIASLMESLVAVTTFVALDIRMGLVVFAQTKALLELWSTFFERASGSRRNPYYALFQSCAVIKSPTCMAFLLFYAPFHVSSVRLATWIVWSSIRIDFGPALRTHLQRKTKFHLSYASTAEPMLPFAYHLYSMLPLIFASLFPYGASPSKHHFSSGDCARDAGDYQCDWMFDHNRYRWTNPQR